MKLCCPLSHRDSVVGVEADLLSFNTLFNMSNITEGDEVIASWILKVASKTLLQQFKLGTEIRMHAHNDSNCVLFKIIEGFIKNNKIIKVKLEITKL